MLVQSAGLILLPLYTTYLTREDFGFLEILTRIGETVSTVLVIGGLRLATLSFYQQADSQEEKRQIVTGSLFSILFTCLFGGICTLLLIRSFPGLVPLPEKEGAQRLLQLAVLSIAIEPLLLIPQALMQARTESIRYAAVNLVLFIARVSLSIFFVAWLRMDIMGVLLATILSVGISGSLLTFREMSFGTVLPTRKQIVGLWSFALPFLPGGLCFFLLHHGDRFWLSSYWGMAEVGIYALGYKLALALNTFALGPVLLVWSPQVYKLANNQDAPRQFGLAFTRMLTLFIFWGMGLCLFRNEVVGILSRPEYAGAASVIIPIVIACLFQTAATLMDSAFYIRRRTDLKLAVTLISTIVMVGLYMLLIPKGGALGAALATLGGFLFLMVSTFFVSQRLFPVDYEYSRLGGILGLAICLFLGVESLPHGIILFWTKWVVWGLFPVILWHAGLISAVEKKYAADLVEKIRTGIRLGKNITKPLKAGDVLSRAWRSSG